MSRAYLNYNQYLGAQKCCNTQGPVGPQGPAGPSAIGSQGKTGVTGPSLTGPTGRSCKGPTGDPGPTQIDITVTALTLAINTVVVPAQNYPIQYYSLNLITGSDTSLTTITFTSLPAGYQAIIYINGNDSHNHLISIPLTGIDYINYSSASNPLTLTQLPGTPKAVLTVYSDGTYKYGNLVLMY